MMKVLSLFVAASLGQIEPATVPVEFKNVTFPVYIRGKDKEAQINEVESKTGGKVPPGKLVVHVLPSFGNAWTQPYALQVGNGKKGEWTIYPSTIDLKKGDTLTVHCGEPIAPWNGTIVPYADGKLLVSLARPWAQYDVEKWEQEKGAKEELPNSAFFLAKYGDKEMAKRLAKHYLDKGTDRTDHVSVISSIGLKLDQAKLEKAIEEGFGAIRLKFEPNGLSVESHIAQAKKLLDAGRGTPKKK